MTRERRLPWPIGWQSSIRGGSSRSARRSRFTSGRAPFVADFVGSANVLPPTYAGEAGAAAKWMSLRPEKIRATAPEQLAANDEASLIGTITNVHYQGR